MNGHEWKMGVSCKLPHRGKRFFLKGSQNTLIGIVEVR
jgi:hypothetical protein